MASSYDYHTTVKLTGEFYDFDGQLADPPDVRINIRRPGGTVITSSMVEPGDVAITREGLGVYSVIIRLTEVGRWCYAWEADDPDPVFGSQPADETYLDVRPSAFAPLTT